MPANKMNKLLNKIERRLGTRQLNLPDYLQKDKWANEVIAEDSLDTFSRFYPNSFDITLDLSQKKKNGYYVIDEYVPKGVEIIGVRDIDWTKFSEASIRLQQANGFGTYNFMIDNYNLQDVALLQMRADHMSLFNNQLFVNFKEPNMVKITNATGADVARGIQTIPLTVFIKHAPNLMTISATMMETFEKLAMADVATFLYEELKYYDNLEAVFINTDLKLSDLKDQADKREDVVNTLQESYVSASNKNQPLILTI